MISNDVRNKYKLLVQIRWQKFIHQQFLLYVFFLQAIHLFIHVDRQHIYDENVEKVSPKYS